MENEPREEFKPEEKSLFIFGRDVSKIPCFRNSFLYGIWGGIGCGLGYFLFTSRVPAATNCAVYSFSAITVLYWIRCRYKFSEQKLEMQRLQKLLRDHALLEGTPEDTDRRVDAER